MHRLDLKLPPLLLLALAAAGMWAVAWLWPAPPFPLPWAAGWALLLVSLGMGVALSGVLAFRQHRTTVNPLRPQDSSAVVQDGIYRYSRNPMYLGMALALLALAVWLRHPLAWLCLPAFILWIDRWQIRPEERALQARFGADYQAYCARVRRWL